MQTQLPNIADYLATPDARPEDIGARQAAWMRDELNGDLMAFATVIFGYKDLIPTLHGDLAQYIGHWGEPGLSRIMTQIPREFFKTSLGTRANALWQICREPHLPVAIFNERDTNAKKWLKAIRDVVMGSSMFQTLYRDLLPPGIAKDDPRSTPRHWKWSDESLDFGGKDIGESECSISAHGIESATTGGHWPKMILDDLISVKHKLSEAEMERAREWVRNHVYLMRPAELGLVYVNCTPWTYHDIYVDLLRDFDYALYKRAALELPDGTASIQGESIFPQKLTTGKLRQMYKRDAFTFNSQMMTSPQPGREQHFNPNWKRHGSVDWSDPENPAFRIDREHYDPTIRAEENSEPPRCVPLSRMNIIGILDPAPSEANEKRAEPLAGNGLLVEGVDPWGRRFILEAISERDDYRGIVDRMFDLALIWGFDTWLIEEVNFSNVYRHWIEDDQKPGRPHDKQFLRAAKLKPGKAIKDKRITGKIPGWRGGDYYINKGQCDALETEMDEYPNGRTVDLLDAMGYDHKILRPESPNEKQRRLYEAQGGIESGRDPITGYIWVLSLLSASATVLPWTQLLSL